MSIRPDSTMFAALHGELVSHPWRDPHVASSDAYSLFVARSSALGWLTEAVENVSGGLWGMNDAGQGPEPSRVAWFQVSLTEPVPDGRPLPVQPFLSCAGDVVARIGAPRLRAVQLLLPVQSLDASTRARAVIPLLQDAGWFADGDPRWRTPVRVTLDGGQEPSIRSAAPEMLRWMRGFTQDVFACDSVSLPDDLTDDGTVLESPVIDELWRGPARHRATFRGVLTEWSLDALGWLAAFLAEAASHNGVGTPLMLTADRPEGSRSPAD
ncbi:hypothetical protein ACFQVD_41670 [Streptosporangium amethystogenes subsp. fukuiense]|uniref:Uncharacterized protein n=1 Tax=Streptosporangium amethystogenes subsp. fukuiense TaxID=698418 RepID=A0ABW2TD94_9ACTN